MKFNKDILYRCAPQNSGYLRSFKVSSINTIHHEVHRAHEEKPFLSMYNFTPFVVEQKLRINSYSNRIGARKITSRFHTASDFATTIPTRLSVMGIVLAICIGQVWSHGEVLAYFFLTLSLFRFSFDFFLFLFSFWLPPLPPSLLFFFAGTLGFLSFSKREILSF